VIKVSIPKLHRIVRSKVSGLVVHDFKKKVPAGQEENISFIIDCLSDSNLEAFVFVGKFREDPVAGDERQMAWTYHGSYWTVYHLLDYLRARIPSRE